MSKQILMMLSDRRPSTTAKIAGVYRYAKIAGWKVQVVDFPRHEANVDQLIELWCPDGCIFESGSMGQPPSIKNFTDMKTVFLDADRRYVPKGAPIVYHDSEADGRLAAKELLSLGRTSFAFIGYPGNLFWSRDREAAFLKTLRIHGKRKCFRLHPESSRHDEIGLTHELADFLKALPDGCGVLVANDFLANIALMACRLASRSVPDELAILGIDNNEDLCLHATPPLSSIAPDFELGGYRAAELLDLRLRQQHATPLEARTFCPITLVRRASTAAPSVFSGVTLKIINVIRDSEGRLSPAEIYKSLPCSRRTAEQQFRNSTGKSILEAVYDMRLKVACRLLLQRQLPISTIASRIGYLSVTAFDRFFLAATGCKPSQWRKKPSAERQECDS